MNTFGVAVLNVSFAVDPSKPGNGGEHGKNDSLAVIFGVVTVIIIMLVVIGVAFKFREKILQLYHQRYGRSSVPGNVKLQELRSVEDESLLVTPGAGASEPLIKANIHEQKTDVKEPLLLVTPGAGASEPLVKGATTQGKDDLEMCDKFSSARDISIHEVYLDVLTARL